MSQLFDSIDQATLDARAARLSRPMGEAVERTERFVTFRRGSNVFAIAAAGLLRAGPLVRPTHLPGAPPHLLGLVHLNGRVVGVLDLERLQEPQAPPPSQAFTLWAISGAASILLVADELLDLLDLKQSQLSAPLRGAFAGRLANKLRAVLPGGLLVLDTHLLLAPELYSTRR